MAKRAAKGGGDAGREDYAAELEEARRRVREAREAWRAAQAAYAEALEQAAMPSWRELREMSAGQLLDRTLQWVRKHPAAGVAAAAAVGYVIGRVTRRLI